MQALLQRFEGDRGIWLSVLVLSLISVLAIYSSTGVLALKHHSGNTEYYLLKHSLLLALGLGVMYVVHKLDYRFFAKISTLLLLASVVLLTYTLFQGREQAVNDANRWVNLFGQSFQPSDLAKFSLMAYLAKILTRKQENITNFSHSFLPIIATVAALCGLIAPADLSTAVLIFSCSLLLMLTAGIKARYLAGFVVVGLIGLVLLFAFAPRQGTWENRLEDYRNRLFTEEYQPNYQTLQANIAISSGNWVGRGAGKSQQRNYLPHPYSDFIYAIIIEEYGFIGGALVLGLYLLILFRSIAIVTISKTFGALLAAGLCFLIVMQAMINMAVTVGLLPVTGLPLPLVSLGGTSLLFTCLSLGVILSVSREALNTAKP